MPQWDEIRVRQVLNLIRLGERCLELPASSPAERAQWAAQVEQARQDLRLVTHLPDLPDDLADAVSAARRGAEWVAPALRCG